MSFCKGGGFADVGAQQAVIDAHGLSIGSWPVGLVNGIGGRQIPAAVGMMERFRNGRRPVVDSAIRMLSRRIGHNAHRAVAEHLTG